MNKIDVDISKDLNETTYSTTLDNGLQVYICKKEGYNKKIGMFGTKYGKRVEEEVKWSGRQLKGTFTDKKQLGNPESAVDPELNKFIKRYIKESLKNKY